MQASLMCVKRISGSRYVNKTHIHTITIAFIVVDRAVDNGSAAFFVRVAFLRTQHVDDNDVDSEMFALRAQTKFQ